MVLRVLKYFGITMAVLLVLAILFFGWIFLVVQSGSDRVRTHITTPSMIDDAKFSEISAALTDDLGLECAKTLDDGRCRYWDTPSTDSGFIRAILNVQYKKHHDGSSSFIVGSYPKTFLLVLSYTAFRHKKAEQLLLPFFAGDLTRAERQHRNLGRDTFTDLRCTQECDG